MEKLDLRNVPFVPYDRDGLSVEGLSWYPLGYCRSAGTGTYLLRYAPGCRTPVHRHGGVEEFVVVCGQLIDHPSGMLFGEGSYGRFAEGTSHYTTSPEGCIVFVLSGGHNQVLGNM